MQTVLGELSSLHIRDKTTLRRSYMKLVLCYTTFFLVLYDVFFFCGQGWCARAAGSCSSSRGRSPLASLARASSSPPMAGEEMNMGICQLSGLDI